MAAPDISAISFWAQTPEDRDIGFAWLRDHQPVSWHRPPEGSLMPRHDEEGGYWAVARYEDIRTVSREPERFSSGRGVMFEDVPPELLEASQSFLAMDDPRHMTLRKLVSAGFTPRNLKALEAGIHEDARSVVDGLEGLDHGDFVELVAKRLPLMTIMRMLGVAEDDRERIVHHADAAVSWNDPEYLAGREPLAVIGEAMAVLHGAAFELASARASSPKEDLLSALVHAEADGQRLTREEIAAFFVLLSVAGNDTTRHATSHTMLALTASLDQRRLLVDQFTDRIDVAIEEFVRWASPVMTFRRTATVDTELAGQPIGAGDKVVMLYPSGNRDERAFGRPWTFDIARDPNRHVGFGGGGPHFCMGAAFARVQLKALFGELLTRYPQLEVTDPVYIVGNFVNGISRMPMNIGARAR